LRGFRNAARSESQRGREPPRRPEYSFGASQQALARSGRGGTRIRGSRNSARGRHKSKGPGSRGRAIYSLRLAKALSCWLPKRNPLRTPCGFPTPSAGDALALGGYPIDHVVPLKQGGADEPGNMQCQTTSWHTSQTRSFRRMGTPKPDNEECPVHVPSPMRARVGEDRGMPRCTIITGTTRGRTPRAMAGLPRRTQSRRRCREHPRATCRCGTGSSSVCSVWDLHP